MDKQEILRLNREEKFKRKVNELHGGKYGLDKVYYTNRQCKVIINCPIHGEVEASADSLLRGRICPLCAKERDHLFRINGTRNRTQEEWVELCTNRFNGKYDYSETDFLHRNEEGKVKIICHEKDEYGNEHGEFYAKPTTHLGGRGCPKCGNNQKSTKSFCDEAYEKFGDKFELSLVDYKGIFEKVLVKCNTCGNVFPITPHNLLKGRGCPQCSFENSRKRYQLPFDVFEQRIKEKFGDKYDLSKVNYINCDTEVEMICKKHGSFMQTPWMLFKGHGCPICGQSALENEVQMLLERNNIESYYEHSFEWLGRQTVDFYLPQYNVAIECQGQQHFNIVNFGGITDKKLLEEKLEYTKNNDKKKKELCDEHNVKLLYFSNLHIDYPYYVIEDKEELLDEIKKNLIV